MFANGGAPLGACGRYRYGHLIVDEVRYLQGLAWLQHLVTTRFIRPGPMQKLKFGMLSARGSCLRRDTHQLEGVPDEFISHRRIQSRKLGSDLGAKVWANELTSSMMHVAVHGRMRRQTGRPSYSFRWQHQPY